MIIEEGAAAFIAGLGVPGPGDRPLPRRRREGDLDVRHGASTRSSAEAGGLRRGRRAGHRSRRPHRQGGGDGAGSADGRRGEAFRCSPPARSSTAAASSPRWRSARRASGWARASSPRTRRARRCQFKQRILEARGSETIVTRCYSGKPMRVIANPYVEEQERHPEGIKRFPEQLIRSAMAGVMNYVDDSATDPEKTCMPAGQGIGGIADILPAGEIVRARGARGARRWSAAWGRWRERAGPRRRAAPRAGAAGAGAPHQGGDGPGQEHRPRDPSPRPAGRATSCSPSRRWSSATASRAARCARRCATSSCRACCASSRAPAAGR